MGVEGITDVIYEPECALDFVWSTVVQLANKNQSSKSHVYIQPAYAVLQRPRCDPDRRDSLLPHASNTVRPHRVITLP